MRYDLAIIGGGAAGFRAACAAQDAGLGVVLFEQSGAGGGVNTSGHYAMERTLRALERNPAYTELNTETREASGQVRAAIRHHLAARGVRLAEEPVSLGGLVSGGFSLRGLDEAFEASNVLLATGSLPWVPDVPGIDRALEEGFALTNHDILGAKKLRASAAVLGGSLRGAQMALYYALLGVPSVLLEPIAEDGRPLGPAPELDADIAGCLGRALEDLGVRRVAYRKLESARQGRIVYMTPEGMPETLETNALVLGSRRLPATRGLGLAELGVATEGGAVLTDAAGHTNVPGIYAAGDCTLPSAEGALRHGSLTSEGARRQAETCVAAITGRSRPGPCVYTGLFAGGRAISIGETMDSAQDNRLRPVEARLPIPYTANVPGLMKLIASRNGNRLVGAHIAGEGMEELAARLIPAIEDRHRIQDIRLPSGSLTAEIAAEALFRLMNELR